MPRLTRPMDLAIDPRLRDDQHPPARAASSGGGSISHHGSATNAASAARASFNSPSAMVTSMSTPGTVAGSASEPGTDHTYGAPETPGHYDEHEHEHSPTDGPGDGGPHDPNDPKRPRACEACRGLKVKCEPDASNPEGPCKRCAKAGRSCVVTQPTRKRQKKTDSRVAELEKKIDALTASLQATRGGTGHNNGGAHHSLPPMLRPQEEHSTGYGGAGGGGGGGGGGGSDYPHLGGGAQRGWGRPPPPVHHRESLSHYARSPDTSNSSTPVSAGIKRKLTDFRESPIEPARSTLPPVATPLPPPPMAQQPQPQQQPPSAERPAESSFDPIDAGIITLDQADEFFQRYNDSMIQHLPAAVIFPPGTTAQEVRTTKPVLFLALMAAASSENPNVQRQLSRDVMKVFADKVMIQGEKNLELVQALQVAVAWYYPPEHFEELKFYQLVHISAVMAIDIGLGRRKANTKNGLVPYTWRDHPFRKKPFPDPTSIESRRAWLLCYFFSTNVSMALHRPNLIRWSPFMAESMDVLEKSPDAAPTDRSLCSLVQVHRLAEEVGIQFSMDDPSAFVDIAEPKVQYALRGFERELAKYKEGLPKQLPSTLELSIHVLDLYMHEIALYIERDENYRPQGPDALQSVRDPVPNLKESLTTAHISALSSCLTAIDGIFDCFLGMSAQAIRCLPVFNFVRIAYGVVVLMKMYFSASTPDSDLDKVINRDQMKVEQHLGRLLAKFKEAAADDRCRPAGKFLVVLAMLRNWFLKQDQAGSAQGSEGGAATGPGQLSQQAQQQQQQNEYNPSNPATSTPLHLLSEVAAGNDSRGSQTPAAGQGTTTSTSSSSQQQQQQQQQQQSLVGWPQISEPNPPSYAFESITAPAAGAAGAGGAQGFNPYLGNAFGADLDYSNMGDFEQAMGMTLSGFPNVGGDGNLEFGLGLVVGDGIMGPMLDQVPGGSLFQF